MGYFNFETHNQTLLPFARFLWRMTCSFTLAMGIMAIALTIGILGYHHYAQLTWIDSLLNAAMILTGMGPVATLTTHSAKVFASLYALFSGVVFLSSVGVLISPIFHRFLHKFHLDDADVDKDADEEGAEEKGKPRKRARK